MASALPPRRHNEDKAARFSVNGNLPVYLVLRMISEQLKNFDIDLQIVSQPAHGMPSMQNPTHLGVQDNYLCLLRNNMNNSHQHHVEKAVEKPKPKIDRNLTYREQVEWFIANYYETGMEFEILLESFKDDDFDNFFWYDEKIEFPKKLSDLKKEEDE